MPKRTTKTADRVFIAVDSFWCGDGDGTLVFVRNGDRVRGHIPETHPMYFTADGATSADVARARANLERDPAEAVSLDVPADHERPPALMGLVGPGAPNPYVAPIQQPWPLDPTKSGLPTAE